MKIESLQNAQVKALVRLKNKKDRDQHKEFLVEGFHMIQEAYDAGILKTIYALEETSFPFDCEIVTCSQSVLNKISSQKSDAKAIGLCKMPTPSSLDHPKRVLLLDRVQDPGNVGTLIRSALSFGIDQVICSPDCADPYNPKTLQSTQGALFHIPIITSPLLEAIEQLKSQGSAIYGAALHQDSIELHDLQISTPFGLVIGNEGQGISDEVLNACSSLVHIEMQTFESLNAAIAGSILMYTFQFAK